MVETRTREGIVYRETPERDLKVDLHLPEGGDGRPAVILLHGGGWRSRNRGMFESHLDRLAGRGYVGADMTYRISGAGTSGEATFPAPIRDVKYGIRWLKGRAGEYGLDPDRVAIGGQSAGAHLAALAAVSPGHPDLEPGDAPGASSEVAAAIPMQGPYNLRKLGEMDPAYVNIADLIRRLFKATYLERPDAYRLASCITHIDGSEPPFLVMTSTNDPQVPFRESVQLRDQLEHAGATAELHIADRGVHGCFTEDPGTHYEEGMGHIEAFLDEHVGGDRDSR